MTPEKLRERRRQRESTHRLTELLKDYNPKMQFVSCGQEYVSPQDDAKISQFPYPGHPDYRLGPFSSPPCAICGRTIHAGYCSSIGIPYHGKTAY